MIASVPTFVVVRHGNTFETGEPARRIGARTDLPLTQKGLAQADALGAHFAGLDWRFERVLASPLLRTRQTAEAILAHWQGTAIAPQATDWLREIDHGPDENQDEDTVLARIGADALAAWDSQALPPPGWTVDAPSRIAAWQDLFARESGPTLLVTSNGAARFALVAAGLNSPAGMKLATGSYGVIDRDAAGTLTVREWGRRP
ncbi:histidine phosphatase family protein [Novosphingobium panipatense]|uniref:histidine phosphatase family protein n=1 Tax=Novosphingobium panipatense TaxID=428991 RepID=UPI0039A0782F